MIVFFVDKQKQLVEAVHLFDEALQLAKSQNDAQAERAIKKAVDELNRKMATADDDDRAADEGLGDHDGPRISMCLIYSR